MRVYGLLFVVLTVFVASTAFAADSKLPDTSNISRGAGLIFGAFGLLELFRRSRKL